MPLTSLSFQPVRCTRSVRPSRRDESRDDSDVMDERSGVQSVYVVSSAAAAAAASLRALRTALLASARLT